MRCDMIGLITFDLLLRIFFRRVMGISSIIKIFDVNFNDCSTHSSRFIIPAYVIADFEFGFHFLKNLFN